MPQNIRELRRTIDLARYLRTPNAMCPDDYVEKINRACARERNSNEGGGQRTTGGNVIEPIVIRRENGAKFNEQTAQMHR